VLLNTAGEKSEIYGEIAIRSPHIALGYWQQLELTAAAFLPDPGGGTRRIYRTGDMGRLLPDGGIMFMGRRDLQVKLHGFRIELGEIEAVLGQHPAVRKAAVRTWEDGFSDKRLVAYVVPTPEVTPTVSELRRFLQTKLPEYMVPSAFIVLDALPLTPNGKLDRRALPAPAPTRPELETVFVAARTHVEEALVKLWAQVLGLNRLGIHDNFFALGGHSLLATQVISRLRDLFRVEVPLRRFFEAPTIAELAVALEQAHESKSELHTPALSPTARELHRVNISSRGA
jgi:acyl carrier protein